MLHSYPQSEQIKLSFGALNYYINYEYSDKREEDSNCILQLKRSQSKTTGTPLIHFVQYSKYSYIFKNISVLKSCTC